MEAIQASFFFPIARSMVGRAVIDAHREWGATIVSLNGPIHGRLIERLTQAIDAARQSGPAILDVTGVDGSVGSTANEFAEWLRLMATDGGIALVRATELEPPFETNGRERPPLFFFATVEAAARALARHRGKVGSNFGAEKLL